MNLILLAAITLSPVTITGQLTPPKPAVVWVCAPRPLEQGGSPSASTVTVCQWVKR